MIDFKKKGPQGEHLMRPKSRDVTDAEQQRKWPILRTDAAHLARFVPVQSRGALKIRAKSVNPQEAP